MTQLQVYIEERQEDQDELYERRKGRQGPRAHGDVTSMPTWLCDLAEKAPNRHTTIMSIAERCAGLTSSEMDECVLSPQNEESS